MIASVVFLAAGVLAFLWYRRRQRQRQAVSDGDAKPDVPARAEDVLNRPDPNEKSVTSEPHTVRIFGGASDAVINLDPESQGDSVAATHGHSQGRDSRQSNPFSDGHSIQSASTGTQSNVIPIALVPPGSVSLQTNASSTGSGAGPVRPTRSADLDLNLDHANVSGESLPSNQAYAKSTRSGIRNSYMTTGSFASDLLNEAPVIVTQSRGQMKQVLGVVKAEVIRTPAGSIHQPEDARSAGMLNVANSRPVVRSPLAGSSFGPGAPTIQEREHESEDEQELSVRGDPFGDEHSPYPASASPTVGSHASPTATSTTFGDNEQRWDPPSPRSLWTAKKQKHTSVNTQAGSIIGATITNASRVHLGLDQLTPSPRIPSNVLSIPSSSDLPRTPISAPLSTAMSTPRSQYRMTAAKIISPMTGSDATPTPSVPSGVLERQQRQAIEEMEAARMSRASVVSSTSTRADSILEGFPFVPPSPISDRPIRTPPRSPLAQQAFSNGNKNVVNPPPAEPLPPPPNRKQLGMSTASQSSTMSNGLGSFPFQIDSGAVSGSESTETASTPSSFGGRQRASLDTLALTADLSSYPLGFDRQAAMANYPGPNSRR